ncbi:hypothetical protein D3C87_1737460 [compost metagenome]
MILRHLFSYATRTALRATWQRRLLVTGVVVGWFAFASAMLLNQILNPWVWPALTLVLFVGVRLLGVHWADRDRADLGATPPAGRADEEAD